MKNKKNNQPASGRSGRGKGPDKDHPVFEKYGLPFQVETNGKVHLNSVAIASYCADEHMIRYTASKDLYERYDKQRGVWVALDEVLVQRLVGDELRNLGKIYHHEDMVRRAGTSKLASLGKMLKPYHAEVAGEDKTGLVHVTNGVLNLREGKPRLMAHDAKFNFTVDGAVKYDAKARCPRFEMELLQAALEGEDIRLLQKYLGSMFLGANECQGILIIRGTPGGGKSTLVSVVEKVLGENLVAYLRTRHLNGRFETSAFLGKRVLIGKDVPGDTLRESGARLLKSLVGGDFMQAEIKYNALKQDLRGDFHVIIVSNNNLRIALDGDQEAWRRRLVVVDYAKEKPVKPIPGFAGQLFAEESAGILNWLVEGAMEFKAEMSKHGRLTLSDAQTRRVEALISDSDSVRAFVKQCVVGKDDGDVSSDELVLAYRRHCKKLNWTPLPSHTFQTRVPDLLLTEFESARRNDIMREGKAVRGFKRISLS